MAGIRTARPIRAALFEVAKPPKIASNREWLRADFFDPEKVDCRTFAAWRFRDVLAQVTATIPDSASLEAKMLCRSIAQLKITLEDMETASARGEKIDRAGYSVMAGQVARLFRQLKANVAGVKFVDDDDPTTSPGKSLAEHLGARVT